MNFKTGRYYAATKKRKIENDRFILYIDLDSGRASCVPESSPIEKNSLGGYIPSIRGNRRSIERIIKRIDAKPSTIEKYIKVFPS